MRASLAVAVGLMVAVVGCSGSRVAIDGTPYVGPEVGFDASDKTHVAVFIAPSAGWRAELDLVRSRFDMMQAFVTLRAPGPDRVVAQVLTEHRVDTGVRLVNNVEVYVRQPSASDAEAGMLYRLAGSAPKR